MEFILLEALSVPRATVDGLAIAFVVMRVAHGVFYLADKGVLRTLAFAGGGVCNIAIFRFAV
ncbi:MAG: MAPEG family protein [Gammaproteobacteria bacterium]|nr:MAPEG family protein [Gammaproteobacteria bacterium]